MTDQDDFDEKRTEGVRIIGAQEAAEAAGRPDVVRRRRRSEKRFGDRPDKPEAASDLPKITISTTETDEGRGAHMTSVPLVRPDSAGPEPDWADEGGETQSYGPTDDDGERINVGHARIIPAELADDSDQGTGAAEAEGGDWGEWSDEEEWSDDEGWSDAQEGAAEVEVEPSGSAEGGYRFSSESGGWSEDDATEAWDASPAADNWSYDKPESGAEYSEDDSFVLPHWTEPPTGQVPKVVIGDSGEPTGSVDYSSQPRWRGEGERTSSTDFGDLLDDGPRLGALGGDPDVEDDFFGHEDFGTETSDEYDEHDDYDEYEYEEEYDDEQGPRPERRRGSDSSSGGGDRNIALAAAVGVGLIALGVVCFKLGAFTTALLATAVLTYAAVEYFTAVREAGFNTATLLGVPAVGGLVFATYTSGFEAYPVVLGLTVVAGLLWYLWVAPGERAVVNLGVTLLGVLWIGFLGSFATLFLSIGQDLMDLDKSLKSNPGIGVLIAAVVVAVSHDVGAYFIGRQFGSTPLSAASPNKTQEGFFGGVLSAMLATFVIVGLFKIHPIGESLSRTVVFAVLCSLVAPLGDLCESAIKRDLKVKDMGSMLPGHGGVLDRFDALLFVLPAAYYLSMLLGVWTLSS